MNLNHEKIVVEPKPESVLTALVKESQHAAGDLVEKVGRVFEKAGFKKIGTLVEEVGDKIQREAD